MEIEGEDAGSVDDMPDQANLIREYNEDIRARVDAIKKEIVSEAKGEKKKKKTTKGKGAGRPHSPTTPKKKRDDEHPITEEEVMAEIGRKKADAEEKAVRVKKQKLENKERKRMEIARKKEEEEREREEKRRKKREEHEREEKKKDEEEDEINLFDRKPRSRAEAARRTKALLGIGNAQEQMDDEEEPRRKKRKYRRRRTSAVSFVKRAKDEEEAGIGCGKYIHNACDVTVEELVTDRPVDSDAASDDENQTHHDVLSLPFLWTSAADKEELPMRARNTEGTFGFLNTDEPIKRRLNDVQKFSDGITEEHRAMTQRLDEMRLNLFAETTFRRTDHKIIHNMNPLSNWSIWPSDLLPAPNVTVPKYQFQAWKRPLTEKLVRIRPTRAKRDKLISEELDRLAGGAAVMARRDIEKNVDELVLSKLKKTTWQPLPSVRNPFDVPEISTRSFVP